MMEQQPSVDAATTDRAPLGLSEMRRRFVFSLLAGLLMLITYLQVKAALRDDAWFLGMAILGFGCFQLLKAGLWLVEIRRHTRQKMGLSSQEQPPLRTSKGAFMEQPSNTESNPDMQAQAMTPPPGSLGRFALWLVTGWAICAGVLWVKPYLPPNTSLIVLVGACIAWLAFLRALAELQLIWNAMRRSTIAGQSEL